MKTLAFATAAASLIALPVLAGNLAPVVTEPYIQPAPQIAPAFTGTDWTGGYVGANIGYGNLGGDEDGSGAVGGLQAGYLYDFGTFVLGGELGLNAANLDFDSGNGQIDSLTTLKMKAGYDAGRTLVYGTLGAAYADGEVNNVSANDTGYLVGAGFDYLLTDSVTVGGEVNYNKFDNFDGTGLDLDATTVGVNVNYRF
jgi:opacity protein-like surface antigen